MPQHHGHFEGVSGLRLKYETHEVENARAALLIVHGLGEHGGRYSDFARAMAVFGISTFTYDQRGHGASEGRRGHSSRFEYLVQDLDRFRREVVQGFTDLDCPVFLLGHSFGGLVALRYLEEYDAPVRGGIISSPWLATGFAVPRWKRTLAPLLNKIAPALPIHSGIDEEHLSHDPQVVQAFRDDPLVHTKITPRLYAEASRVMGLAFQRSQRLHVPLLFLIAGDDRIVDAERSIRFARSLGGEDVTVEMLHGYFHEVLNEPDRLDVYQLVHAWIDAHV